MSDSPSDLIACEPVWEEYPVNTALIIIGAVLTALLMPGIIRVFRYLVGGIFRDKPIFRIDGNVGLTRTRNELAVVMLIPFSLIISKYNVYKPSFLSQSAESSYTLIILAVAVAVFIIKSIVSTNVAAKSSMRNMFIITTMILCLSTAALNLTAAENSVIRMVILAEMGLMLLVSTLRTMHFLKDNSKVFNAIVYLCALEIIPAIILIATAVL